jgi:hypothetical protein
MQQRGITVVPFFTSHNRGTKIGVFKTAGGVSLKGIVWRIFSSVRFSQFAKSDPGGGGGGARNRFPRMGGRGHFLRSCPLAGATPRGELQIRISWFIESNFPNGFMVVIRLLSDLFCSNAQN